MDRDEFIESLAIKQDDDGEWSVGNVRCEKSQISATEQLQER